MQYLIFDHMEAVSEEHIRLLLPQVSAQRREQALRFRHLFGQFACLQSYVMLMDLLRQYHPTLYPNVLPAFTYNSYGCPSLPDGPFFSISHCKTAIAVAIHDTPIGIDIESSRSIDPALIAHTMNTREQTLIAASPSPERAFIRLWTQKEAVLKMQGTGIIADLHPVLDLCTANVQTIDLPDRPYIFSIAR